MGKYLEGDKADSPEDDSAYRDNLSFLYTDPRLSERMCCDDGAYPLHATRAVDALFSARYGGRKSPDDPKQALHLAKSLRSLGGRNSQGGLKGLVELADSSGGINFILASIVDRYGSAFCHCLLGAATPSICVGQLLQEKDLSTVSSGLRASLQRFLRAIYGEEFSLPTTDLAENLDCYHENEIMGVYPSIPIDRRCTLRLLAAAYPAEARNLFLQSMKCVTDDLRASHVNDFQYYVALRNIPWKLREFSCWLELFANCERELSLNQEDLFLRLDKESCNRRLFVPESQHICDLHLLKSLHLAATSSEEEIIETIQKKCGNKRLPVVDNILERVAPPNYRPYPNQVFTEGELFLFRRWLFMIVLMDAGVRRFMLDNVGGTKYERVFIVQPDDSCTCKPIDRSKGETFDSILAEARQRGDFACASPIDIFNLAFTVDNLSKR